MRTSSLFSVAAGIAAVAAYPSEDAALFKTYFWQAPGPNDVRAPCPMLNTLANHGFLPRSGKDISLAVAQEALHTALHFNTTLTEILFGFAVETNPQPNATTFSLNHLSRHNILEHDASLSRTDAYFGDPQPFNATVFAETTSHWTGPLITVQTAANARAARIQTSKKTNPEYSMSQTGETFGFGESGALIFVVGDKKKGTVPKAWIEYLFEHERLPHVLGWSRAKEPITFEDLEKYIGLVRNATDPEFYSR